MSTYKYITSFPKPLLDSILQNRCVPFIGSGFSKNAILPPNKTMPNWDELGKKFANEIDEYTYTNAIDAISAYSHEYSRPNMAEKMKDLLLTGVVKPGDTHEALCQLQFDILCTTNLDRLLEEAFKGKPYCAIFSESQLSMAATKDETILLKMHGDIYHPDSMVVTEEDYDKFLDTHTVLSTYVSNLLITRTPLFIGYSLDDSDFRQIWQIIKNRLGKLTRQAYVLKVGCSNVERLRFERRGVKVINLEGETKNYSRILRDTFKELYQYWTENLKTISESSTQQELELPNGSLNRLCFFSVPLRLMPFYKEYLFPIARQYGFVPITADSVVSVSDNWMAKVSSLLSKAEYFVVDLSSKNTMFEFSQMIKSKKDPKKIFLIKEKDLMLAPFGKGVSGIERPADFMNNPEIIVDSIGKWFKSQSKLHADDKEAPLRLIEKEEYRSAVISAAVLLEVELRNLVEDNAKLYEVYGLVALSQIALEEKIITKNQFQKIREFANQRNLLVHTNSGIQPDIAKAIVHDVLRLIDEFRK